MSSGSVFSVNPYKNSCTAVAESVASVEKWPLATESSTAVGVK